MLINPRISILYLVLTGVLCIPMIGTCDSENTFVGGIEIIREITEKITSCMSNEQTNITTQKIEQATSIWHTFVERYEKLFEGEIEQPERLSSIIADISAKLNKTITHLKANETEKALKSLGETKEMLNSLLKEITLPILLDFTGARCKSCKIMKARLKKIAPDFIGRVRISFVDVNKQKELTREFKIMLIPTLVFINRNGEEVSRKSGKMEENVVRQKLENLVEE